MKIRFFNTYEPVTSLYRDLAPPLAKRGDEVVIVLSRGLYRKERDLAEAFKGKPGIKLVRTLNLGRHAYQGFLSKLVVIFGYMKHASCYALLGPAVDLNVFLTQPPFFTIFGVLQRALRRQPYVVLLMDIQPQLSVALGLMKPQAIWTRALAWVMRLSLRRAQGVVVIGRCMAECVAGLGVPSSRIRVIPNWADESQIVPVPHSRNPVRRQQGWEDRLVIAYAGNLGLPQEFEIMLKVADRLRDRPEILFAFIGEGVKADWLRKQVAARHLDNVQLFPFLHDRYSLSEILSAGDVHLVSLKEACTGLAVPSKTYGVLAAGRPVIFIGSRDCEIARLVGEEQVGCVVSRGETDRLEEAVLRYADSPELLRSEGEKARSLAEGPYSRNQAISRYLELLSPGVVS